MPTLESKMYLLIMVHVGIAFNNDVILNCIFSYVGMRIYVVLLKMKFVKS